MTDLAMLALLVVAAVVMAGYIAMCDRIGR
jgi:hypothetical protein